MVSIKRIKYFVRILIVVLVTCYTGSLIVLDMPSVQQKIASAVSGELKRILKSDIQIGEVDLGLFNRIIIEDVMLKDLQGKDMLKVSRLSAKFELLPLFKKKISISSIQLYGFSIHLNRETPHAIPNYQFVIDAFASKDSVKTPPHIDLRINSILIRRGQVTYDVISEATTPERFNASHIHVDNLSASISIKALRNDTLNASVRRLNFKEQSGIELKKFTMQIIANDKSLKINDFNLQLPSTTLNMDEAYLTYDSLSVLPLMNNQVSYGGNLNGQIYPKDFSSLFTPLEGLFEPFDFSSSFEGKGDDLRLTKVRMYSQNLIRITGDAQLKNWKEGEEAYLDGRLTQFVITEEGLTYLKNNLDAYVPPFVERMKSIGLQANIHGKLNNIKADGTLKTDVGTLVADVNMKKDNKGERSFSGTLMSDDMNLGQLMADEKQFGIADFNIGFEGFNYQKQYPQSYIKGIISSFDYSGYRYKNITLDGEYKDGGFNGKLSLDDENGKIQIDGQFNATTPTPTFNLTAIIEKLKPHELLLSDKYENSDISLRVKADFTGRSTDDVNGYVRIDSLVMNAPEGQGYKLDNLLIKASKDDDKKLLQILSPIITASVRGDFSYQSLPKSFTRMAQQYVPSLYGQTPLPLRYANDFEFDVRIENAELFEKVFYIPIRMHMPSTIRGFFNDKEERLKIEGAFPQFTYDGTLYESAVLQFENPSDQLICKARAGMLMKSGAMLNVAIEANAKNDHMDATLNWGNNTDITYGGKIKALARFTRNDGEQSTLRTDIDLQPTQMVMNDTIWQIHPSHIAIDSGYVYIDDFLVEHADQHLSVNGKITDRDTDTCYVDLKNIHAGYVLDILRFDDVDFDGIVTGKVYLNNLHTLPSMHTELNVRHFTMNDALLGNTHIKGFWDNELGGIVLDAQMEEKDISRTHVTGYVSPKKKGLDLQIKADSMNLAIISPYLNGIFSEMNARVNGDIRLFGPFKYLDFEGKVRARFDAKLDVLNTYFQIRDDSIHVTPGEIAFNNMRIFDREGNSSQLNGYLRHNKLKNMTYRFDVDADNLLVYDSDDPGDMSLYGRVYAIGNILVRGGNNAMNIDVNMTTGRNTTFTYVSGITTSATSNQFITFVDKTPKRIQDMVETDFYHYTDALEKKEDDGPPMDLYINMMVDATPDAQMKVIMDPVSGDYISARGTGNLQVNYYNKGNFRMFGNYVIDQGVYKLSMQEVIRKDFALQSGGTVTFSGDPYFANLDLQAVYTVNSVSLSDLSTDASLNQSTVKVNCVMNITGSLADPTIRFDLDLPSVSEEDKELVRSATSTEEQMNTQIIYLLTIGKFYTYDYAENGRSSSNATSSLAFNTLSGQLNNMLSQWTENKNWNIGANLSTGEEGWNDVEAEAILSGRLLNNRLIINGNFGYRENVLANTNFIGDFEAIWLLTQNGDWRIRAYNQTNDRYFTKSTLTTQGVGLMYKKDFDGWGELFHWFTNKWKKENNKNNEGK